MTNEQTEGKKPSVWATLRSWLAWLGWCVVCCAATLLLAKSSWSHELPANRLTLVMRDATHVSLTYYIDYPSALHRALAPQQTLQQFELTASAMPPAEFQKALLKAQAKFSAGTQLTLLSKNKSAAQATPLTLTLALTHWQWPDAKSAQALLQQRAMHTLVGAGEHPLELPFEIRAEAASKEAITSLEVRLPEELSKVLVVSYRPQQAWTEPRSAGLLVKF